MAKFAVFLNIHTFPLPRTQKTKRGFPTLRSKAELAKAAVYSPGFPHCPQRSPAVRLLTGLPLGKATFSSPCKRLIVSNLQPLPGKSQRAFFIDPPWLPLPVPSFLSKIRCYRSCLPSLFLFPLSLFLFPCLLPPWTNASSTDQNRR